MMSLPHHMDNVHSVSQCLSENRDKNLAKERDETLSSSPETLQETPRKSRRVIIREEWVDLTNDSLIAALLSQMVQECQKLADFELYLEEEGFNSPTCLSSPQHGWFHKSSQDLIEEAMLRVTLSTLRRYMSFLKSRGWIQTRRNPENKLDSKVQYRVNLRKLCTDLQKKGHCFPGFNSNEVFSHVPKEGCL